MKASTDARASGGAPSDRRPVELRGLPIGLHAYAGQTMKPDELDQRSDLRLRAPDQDLPSPHAQTARQYGEIQHQRGVSERQVAEIDHDVGLRANRAGQRAATDSLGRPVLVAGAPKRCGVFIEADDPGKLPKCRRAYQPSMNAFVNFERQWPP